MVLVVKTIEQSKTASVQRKSQNDIIEFHIRPDESQFPYTLEMLL